MLIYWTLLAFSGFSKMNVKHLHLFNNLSGCNVCKLENFTKKIKYSGLQSLYQTFLWTPAINSRIFPSCSPLFSPFVPEALLTASVICAWPFSTSLNLSVFLPFFHLSIHPRLPLYSPQTDSHQSSFLSVADSFNRLIKANWEWETKLSMHSYFRGRFVTEQTCQLMLHIMACPGVEELC